MKIIIATPSLVGNDAVSIDVWQQHTHFRSLGIRSYIYAQNRDDSRNEAYLDFNTILRLVTNSNNILIYHHSINWVEGETIIKKAKCRVVMKYHNITPSKFFAKYDRHLTEVTQKGRVQTKKLIDSGKFESYVGDSIYNSRELIDLGTPIDKTFTIAPFHRTHDFDRIHLNLKLYNKLLDGRINVLFVGRVAPNKGHLYLIEVLNRYVDFYGIDVRLILAGNLNSLCHLYFEEIKKRINQYNLGELIHFAANTSFGDLKTYYATSHVFLLMSEHEGFCVPIIEAQYNKLPIVALDRAAVKETMGSEQLVNQELDYDFFASAIHQIANDKKMKVHLTKSGYQNYLGYEASRIFTKTRTLLGLSGEM